ncbi:hypothetical protein ACTQ6A_13945 [Lachnospiraceae bacterium LCP25S3_G4]
MGVPKSVVKLSKNGIEYTSNVDKCQYLIHELTRAALRDVGKFLVKEFRDRYYSHFKRHTGDGGRATKYKVISSASTQYPRVQIGLKTGKTDGFYSYFQEFGSSRTPRLGLLTKSAESNVAEIVKIESQYLSSLEDEASALALINESEMEGDASE